MKDKFLNLINIKPEEFRMAFSLWILLAINTLVLELADVVATAGFISNLGAAAIPWLWVITTVIVIFATSGYLVLIDKFPRLNLVSWLMIGLAVIYLFLQMMFAFNVPDWISYPILYLVADQQLMILPLAFWALANDVYSVTESKRIFPIIASGAVIGGLLGNGLATLVTYFAENYSFGLSQIFIGTSIILIGSVVFLRLTFRGVTSKTRQSREADTNIRETINIGLDYFQNVPALKAVGVIMLCAGIVLTIVEFHFFVLIETSVNSDPIEFQRFLGYYKAIQTTGLLGFQYLVTSRVLSKVPLKNAFAVLPIVLTLSCLLTLGLPILLGVAAARFTARTFYVAWDDPARKALQGLIPDEKRGRISAFMDSYFITIATIIGSIGLILLQVLQNAEIISAQVATWSYLGFATVAAISGVIASIYLRKNFEVSMLNYRLARSKRKSVLDGIEF